MSDAVQRLIRIMIYLIFVACLPATAVAQEHAVPVATTVGSSGLPVPRFVSLKADRVNVRKGPSIDHKVTWIYRRLGLPVEIIAESELWRHVRDADGIDGWVFHSLLSARRTALIVPWEKNKDNTQKNEPAAISLHNKSSASSTIVANMEPGVLVNVDTCDGNWCLVTTNGFRGWVEQVKLWGVYRGEPVK